MTISKNVIDGSMTIFSITIGRSGTFTKMSLIDQWQFSQTPLSYLAPLQNCHWSINDNFPKHHWHTYSFTKLSLIDQWQFWKVTRPVHGCTFTEIVIDQSMTILKGLETCPWVHLYRKCHWSMTVFKIVIDQWQFLKLSLIDQWQFWKVTRPVPVCTFTESVIDWSMTISKNVIDRSMKIFPKRLWHKVTFTESVIDRSMTTFIL